MKKILYLLLLTFSFLGNAQTYTWKWAQYGGGDNGSFGSGFTYTQDESIRDIAVDSNNNYYYLATNNPGSPTLNGTPVTNYDSQDLFLFSTDCQGNVRWTKTIGGRLRTEYAWNIELDNNGGLYLLSSFRTTNNVTDPSPIPIHLDTNVTLPLVTVPYSDQTTIDPALKTAYLLKYNTSDGSLAWYQALQGDVSWSTRNADSAITTMDSSKNIHAIIGFRAGTHLNGLITVPASYTSTYQYYLVKFNYTPGTGNIVNMIPQANPLLLPITGEITQGMSEGKVNLVYDETLNRYYLAGKRMYGDSGTYADFSFGGNSFTQNAYLLAFDGATGSEIWRREINNTDTSLLPSHRIDSIVKDNAGNIYICGFYQISYLNGIPLPVTFNKLPNQANPQYSLPNTTGVTAFIMKLNGNGDVLWATYPSGYSSSATSHGYDFRKGNLVFNANEIAFVKGSVGDTWGTFPMVRPPNDTADPLLVRLNKDTGAVLGTNEVLSPFGSRDEFTAVAADMDGNYVVGGFKHSSLFVDTNDGVPDLNGNTTSGKSQFFFAKLATSTSCTQMATAETPVKETDLVFYPNPVEDVLQIKTKEKLQSYEVITADGRLVRNGKFERTGYTVDMQGLTKGVYYVKVKSEGFATAGKIVKK